MKHFLSFLFVSTIYFSSGIAQVSDSLFKLFCEYEDLIILDEDIAIRFNGQKAAYINVDISTTTKYIIKNQDGLSELSVIELPKRFDDLYINHASSIRNTDWAFERITIKNFNASVLKNGTEIQLQTEAVTRQKRVINDKGFFGDIDIYDYHLKDLSVGDTVIISHFYWLAFNENWLKLLSNRIFLHGNYPKKQTKLTWCYNINMEVDSGFINMDPPALLFKENLICYEWEMQNLPGALDEPNSRPYEELPYMLFVPKPYDFEYTHFDSYIQEFIPVYFYLANRVQEKIRVEMWDNVIGTKDKDNLHYSKVADKIISKAKGDTVGLELFRYFQQYMVDSVRYKDDVKYYSHEAQHLKQRAGVDLYGYVVSDNNLERIYGNITPKLAKDLFTAYPVDKRVGSISRMNCTTVNSNDLMFLPIFHNGTGGFVIPRSEKNHYYFDELPFYYEDIPVMLLHVYDYSNPKYIFPENYDFSTSYYNFDYGSGKRNFNTQFRSIITPASNPTENYRKVQSKISLATESLNVKFQTRIFLSGQYSTLTRCVYCEKPVDSTINPIYLDPVWNISEQVNLINIKVDHPQITFPFKTTINLNYSADDIVDRDGENLMINIGNWFKLVVTKTNENEQRHLDYYPDFQGSDQYSYMLEFDKPVTLISEHSKKEVSNDYARFCFEATQTEENKILLTCNYNIKAQHVEKKYYDLVAEINAAISALKQEKIVFKIVQ